MGPKCDQCELSAGLCPSASSKKGAKASSSKKGKGKGLAASPSPGAGPKIEVKLEEDEHEDQEVKQENEERKVDDVRALAAAPERISPQPDVPVKLEETS